MALIIANTLLTVEETSPLSIKSSLNLAYKALKSNGRLITSDRCIVKGQKPIARFLIKQDRGQNIKTEDGYLQLAKNVESSIHHSAWIP